MLVRFGTLSPQNAGATMAETPQPQSISIVYEDNDQRPTIPVNGAFGGPSVDGTLVFAHLYSEYVTVPAMEEHEADDKGRVDLHKGNVIKRGDLTRKVLATLVLSPEAALGLGQWLASKGQQALQVRKETSE